jgi:hypothetical protein
MELGPLYFVPRSSREFQMRRVRVSTYSGRGFRASLSTTRLRPMMK